ncbi:MAG: NAD-dependent epimerase/dehydratase family protein [Candidatus Omnitrophota bacterium]|nr:MAG: NAD-dependent epimerase/dehydratase family protein [Candidatus Omnitrophota bacterium]
MKVLVTGGSGFIGSHVVDKLKDKGVDVRVFDAMPTFRKDIEYYQGSLLDMDALGFAMNGVDAVMHLAAIADVKDVFNRPHYAESINVRGTINVLEAARAAKLRRVVYGSTTWVYSEAEGDSVDEATPLHAPSHLYTATKLVGEYYCRTYSELFGLDYTILRYGIPYGPRARDEAVIPIFVRKALSGEALTIAGDGSQFRKFVFVEDLAEGNILALQSIARNKIYNLDGVEKVTIRQIAETIKRILGDVKIEYTPARPGDFAGKEVSSELVKKELGWEPKVGFEEGIRRYLKWYSEREKTRKANWEKLDDTLKK